MSEAPALTIESVALADALAAVLGPLLADRLAEVLATRLRSDAARLLTAPELAARLGYRDEDTVRALVRRGQLPPPLLATAGSVRWDWEQVRQHLVGQQARQARPGGRRRKGRGMKRPAGAGE